MRVRCSEEKKFENLSYFPTSTFAPNISSKLLLEVTLSCWRSRMNGYLTKLFDFFLFFALACYLQASDSLRTCQQLVQVFWMLAEPSLSDRAPESCSIRSSRFAPPLFPASRLNAKRRALSTTDELTLLPALDT